MSNSQQRSYFDAASHHQQDNRYIFEPPAPFLPSNSNTGSLRGPRLQRRCSSLHRQSAASTCPARTLPRLPSTTSNRRSRPRVFSAPSFENRVSTNEVERGRYVGSATSSRSVSLDTHMPPALWNSVFNAMRQGNSRRSSRTTLAGMSRMGSRVSMTSAMSTTSLAQYDPDDPHLTGKLKEKASVDLPNQEEGEKFILLLTQALMKFGAPSHRIESQLMSAASLIRIKMQVVHIPGVTIISFKDHTTKSSGTDTCFVKSATKIDLGRLHEIHNLYKRVVHYEQSAKSATEEMKVLLKKESIFSVPAQVLLAIICGLIISPMAYRGSFLDLLAAGCCCGVISWLHLWAAKKNMMFANFVEITSAIFVAFAARGLSNVQDGVFCYSAIASAGIVKLLPKYLIICGSLELASKQIITGSVKMVYAIIWSLFLGFAITLGSDFYYLVDSQARERRYNATQYLDQAMVLRGAFSVDDASVHGLFHFTNITTPRASSIYSVNGCYRSPDWPWYLQSPPAWTLLFLVPLYGIFSALASFQPFFSRELPVMVFVSCCSYAANRGVHVLIPSRPDISGAIGAFVIGALGHLYSRIFHGTAFIAMFNGIGFLVPSAIAATGGLAQNYRGKNGSHYTSSLELALRMITVAIGTTVGLFTSSLVVYSFGRKKRGALWAF